MDEIKRSGKKFNDYLVEMVKACGQDLVENAENIVGKLENRTDFTIQISLAEEGEANFVPKIEILTAYISRFCLEKQQEMNQK